MSRTPYQPMASSSPYSAAPPPYSAYPVVAPQQQQQPSKQQSQVYYNNQSQQPTQYSNYNQQQQYVPPSQYPVPSAPTIDATSTTVYRPLPGPLNPVPIVRLSSASPCRDAVWAILFLLHFIAICVVAGVCWSHYSSNITSDNNSSSSSSGFHISLSRSTIVLLATCIVSAMVTSIIWLGAFQRYATAVIWFCLGMVPAVCIALAVVCFVVLKEAYAGAMLIISALLSLLFMYFARSRVAFSGRILSISATVTKMYPATIILAAAGVAVQVGFFVIWIVAAAGATQALQSRQTVDQYGNVSQSSDSSLIWAWVGLLLSMFWSFQVFKNISHVTTAGVMARWYFRGVEQQVSKNPTLTSFKRATITSFGSICLGSLLVAIVKTIRAIVEMGKRSENQVARCIVLCILGCLERLVEWFNMYAYSIIAIYGTTYCTAAGDAWNLLKSTGVSALINDDIISDVILCVCIINGLVGAAIAAVLSKFAFTLSLWGIWALIGFVVAFAMTSVMLEVVHSAAVSFFVCWAEDPQALQVAEPIIFESVMNAINTHRLARPQAFVGQPNPMPQRQQQSQA